MPATCQNEAKTGDIDQHQDDNETGPDQRRRCRPAPPGQRAMERVFLGDLFPGIIEFGRVNFVRYFLAVTGWHGFP